MKKGSKRPGGKTAIIAITDYEYGLACIFQTTFEGKATPYEVEVFETLEEAKQWMFAE
ncbi:MAG: hypothetical protein JXQ30_13550 [Spirochaetes bacterium]|nr:hypothetical protein [Spirochaetota bacterium]